MVLPQTLPTYPQVIHKLFFHFYRVRKELSTNPHHLLLRLFLILLLLIFPANLAKAFILPETYVLGVLVDYLVPKLYLTEILVSLVLLLSFWEKPKNKTFPLLLGLFLLTLMPSLFLGSLPIISSVRFGQLTLWFLFAFWVSQNLKKELGERYLTYLGWGTVGVVLLALVQLVIQHSVLGYWALGEPYLTPSLGGVAKGSFLGREFLRPYGTFPHPNVMGGVLSVLSVWFAAKKKWGIFVFAVLGTLISFSQLAWTSLGLGLLGSWVLPRAFPLVIFDWKILLQNPSIQRRLDLLVSAWEMVKSAPFWGMGLGSFTKVLPVFGVPAGILLFIQPVHNIFALVAAESGLPALLAFLALFFFAFQWAWRKKNYILLVSLSQLVLLGFFDHYLYTLPQGLFLLSLTMGLVFSK